MEFGILGQVEVYEDGRTLPVGGKQRALLALLLLEPGTAVSQEHLIDELWGDAPPETAAKAVRVFATRLRNALPGIPLRTRGGAFVLDVEPGQIDRGRFEHWFEAAREARAAGAPERAAVLLRDALALWRGPPLADVQEPFARAAAHRLEELRLAALEERIEADLALGRHAALAPELDALAREHPLRERFRAQLMLALYRSGRQAEALEAYRAARRTLVDELGIEPARELQQLEQAILVHDTALELSRPPAAKRGPEPPAPADRTRRPRMLFIAAAAVALVALAAASAVVVGRSEGDGRGAIDLERRSVGRIDPDTGRLVAQVSLGAGAAYLAGDAAGAWVATGAGTAAWIDPRQNQVTETVALGFRPSGLAAHGDTAWIGSARDPQVMRVSRHYERVVGQPVRLPRPSSRAATLGPAAPRIAYGGGSFWVASGQTLVARVNPSTGRIEKQVEPRAGASGALAFGAGALWIGGNDAVTRVAPGSAIPVKTIPLPANPTALAFAAGALWVALDGTASIVRIDPASDRPVHSVAVGGTATAMAGTARAVWAVVDETLVRIDERTNAVTRLHVRSHPTSVAVAAGAVWVGTA